MSCKIEQCDKPGEYIRGMCPMHYQRWRRYGDPLWEPKRTTLEERFWAKVRKTDDCWTWTAGGDVDGYGAFSRNRQPVKAHRYSWELHFGPIADGLWVLHRCDNPRCVRPDHLFLGTHTENMADMKRKGRSQRGERTHFAKLTDLEVAQIRAAVSRGERHVKLAEQYNVNRATISMIALGNTWKHLEAATSSRGGRPFENSKLTLADVRAARAASAAGESQRAIAARFGVSRAAIGNLLSGKTWSSVT